MIRERAGYSLLEVLVAFAILTSVLAVLLPGKTTMFSRINDAESGFLAQDYAISRLDRLVVEGWPTGVSQGTISETYRGWEVELSAETPRLNAQASLSTSGDILGLLLTVEVFDRTDDTPLAVSRRYVLQPQVDAAP